MIELSYQRDLGITFPAYNHGGQSAIPRLTLRIAGTKLGNCTFKTDEGKQNARTLIDFLELRTLAKPSLGFSNKCIPYEDARYDFDIPRTPPPVADGVFVTLADTVYGSVFIPNADCPVAVVSAVAIQERDWCSVVCHVGLKTFDHEHTLLDNAYAHTKNYMGSRPYHVSVVTGLGARPCCYGLSERENQDLISRLTRRFDIREQTVKHGPCTGQLGIDIESLVVQNIEELDRSAAVETLGVCTSCYGFETSKDVVGFGSFFSNLRDGRKTNARNGLIVTIG